MIPNNQSFLLIWDSAQTLTTIHKWGIIKEIGFFRFLCMLAHGYTPASLRKRIYEIFIAYEGEQVINPLNGEDYVRDEYGTKLPHFIVHKWLSSQLTDKEILDRIDTCVDQWASKQKYVSNFEKSSLKKTMYVVLSAESIAKNTRPIKKAINIVKKCHEKKYTQYILSNWQKEAFEKIFHSNNNQSLFAYFNPHNVISSGACGLVKPHRSIFEHILIKNNLKAEECLFIDDQEENVHQARACGMQAVLLKRGNYKKLEQDLRKLNVL